jgi:hypothetical protein
MTHPSTILPLYQKSASLLPYDAHSPIHKRILLCTKNTQASCSVMPIAPIHASEAATPLTSYPPYAHPPAVTLDPTQSASPHANELFITPRDRSRLTTMFINRHTVLPNFQIKLPNQS